MELHLVFELRSPSGTAPHRDLYPAMLDMAGWADERGFAYVNFGEHHMSKTGYLPSPLVTRAAVTGRTRRIRMRPNVLLTPFYNPIRLAEDTAVLSLTSGGRFDLVLGGGYRQRECDLYGTKLKDRWRTIGETPSSCARHGPASPSSTRAKPSSSGPPPTNPRRSFSAAGAKPPPAGPPASPTASPHRTARNSGNRTVTSALSVADPTQVPSSPSDRYSFGSQRTSTRRGTC